MTHLAIQERLDGEIAEWIDRNDERECCAQDDEGLPTTFLPL
jgi:hypothetical protein